ncbi:MAG TPA: T9SS type A sorting domain-containing protein [Ignavibacteriaceae bacterium]|nr:T9SS type A sorting domain-containing protein [Ignavibacteriaceae bacterium]
MWVEKNDLEILNNGLPLNPSTEAKDPSITFSGESGLAHRIYVTYQEKMPDNTYVIKLVKFSDYGNLLYSANIYKSSNTYDKKAEPVIAASYGGSPVKDKIMFVWKEEAINDTAGGFRAYGVFDEGNTYSTHSNFIPDVLLPPQSTVTNPTLDVIKTHGAIVPHFQLAWQSNDRIYYRYIGWGSGFTAAVPVELSAGSGYTYNRYPSIIARIDGSSNQTARISWQGERYEEVEMRTEKIGGLSKTESRATPNKNVLFKSTDYYRFWAFGNNRSGKPSINQSDEGYIIAWSENNGDQVKCVNNSLNQLKIKTVVDDNQIPLKGEGVQVLNGTFSNEELKVVSLNTETLPYHFQESQWLDFSKVNNKSINIAREGVVYQGDAQMYFSFGDVQLNGSNIDFIEIPEDVPVNCDSQLNKYMRTENFILNNESNFVYSVLYGITDSAAVTAFLSSGNEVNFVIELVDGISGEVLGRYDEVKFNEGNVFQYNNLGYEVSGEGINNRTVYLRLRSSSNTDVNYSLSQKYSDEVIFGKNNTKKINYTGTEKPTEYALYQNYPNPFNPTTTINYQIPKEGLVTLKIYDILGKEVATLINEEKQAGKYSIEFSASKLSSGVYLYELRSNEFKSTKKLLLMK